MHASRAEGARVTLADIAKDVRARELSERVHLGARLLTPNIRGAWVIHDERIPSLTEAQRGALARLVLRDALADLERAELATPGDGGARVPLAHLEQRALVLLKLELLTAHVRIASSATAQWCDVAELTELNRMVGDAVTFATGKT